MFDHLQVQFGEHMPSHKTYDSGPSGWRQMTCFIALIVLMLSSCQPAATPTVSDLPAANATAAELPETNTLTEIIENQPVPGGPVLLRSGISLRKFAQADAGSIKLALHPPNGELYVLSPSSGLYRLNLDEPSQLEKVASTEDIATDATVAGMSIGPDGIFFVVANSVVKRLYNQAIIRAGTLAEDGAFSWKTVAQSEPYPLSGTPFDHRFSGIVVSPDGKTLYVSSGSRTDHGEVENNSFNFQDTREVPLTAKIFQIPADAENLTLANDEEALKTEGLIFAWGTRNAYDMAFTPNGDLFGIDNGPDADFPDELNWLREGNHYGFPWQFGDLDNPQQFPEYMSEDDKRLSSDFTAVQNGTYRTDPTFPNAPGGFTVPVANLGPDAAQYLAEDGSERNAAEEGIPL